MVHIKDILKNYRLKLELKRKIADKKKELKILDRNYFLLGDSKSRKDTVRYMKQRALLMQVFEQLENNLKIIENGTINR